MLRMCRTARSVECAIAVVAGAFARSHFDPFRFWPERRCRRTPGRTRAVLSMSAVIAKN